jgi:hypothetical protein
MCRLTLGFLTHSYRLPTLIFQKGDAYGVHCRKGFGWGSISSLYKPGNKTGSLSVVASGCNRS